MPKRVTMALSLTWHELAPSEVLPMVEGLAKMLRGTGVNVEMPEAVARDLSEETRRSLGIVMAPRALTRGPGYMARGRAHRGVLQDTVDAYEAAGRDANQTATVMGVDRNTIYQRVSRAKQLGIGPGGHKETP